MLIMMAMMVMFVNDDWVADIDITTTRWHRNWAKQHFVKQEMIIFIFFVILFLLFYFISILLYHVLASKVTITFWKPFLLIFLFMSTSMASTYIHISTVNKPINNKWRFYDRNIIWLWFYLWIDGELWKYQILECQVNPKLQV